MNGAAGKNRRAPWREGPASALRAGRARRRGTILIVTMWIVLVLAGLVLVLARAMRVEIISSANEFSAAQAEAVELAAVQYVLAHVDSLEGDVPSETDTPCEAVRVGQAAFWIIRPSSDSDRTYAFGITDEASKVNLNNAAPEMLLKLPNMTDEFAASIVDWRDSDSDISPNGAENEYYLLRPSPYQCKNAPLETVDELFLIKGASAEIIYGEDSNRNGVLDPNEDDGDVSDPPDNRDGRLDRGIAPFVTVYSLEPNTAADGTARLNVNDARGQALASLLGKTMKSDRVAIVVAAATRGRPFRNVLDFYVRTGLTATEFAGIADSITTLSATTLRGRINVNTAPREVLACLPTLDDSDVSALLAKRAETGIDLTNVAWVAQALRPEKAVAVGDFVTVRTFRFSADIVSVSADGRAFRRCRVVVDNRTAPKVIYRQDLTHLGWPLDPDIIAQLRAGRSLDEVATRSTLTQRGSP